MSYKRPSRRNRFINQNETQELLGRGWNWTSKAQASAGCTLGVLATILTTVAIALVITLFVVKQDELPMESVVRVGPTRPFKTVTQVLQRYKQHVIGDLTIIVDPGEYAESYDFSGLFGVTEGFRGNNNNTITKGVSIRAANVRAIDGVAYVDSYPFVSGADMIQEAGHTLVTDADIGPFTVYISPPLLEMGADLTYPFTAEIVLAEPLDACTPLTNDLTGKIGLAIRGGCAFTIKGQNMADAGAVAQVVYNSNPGLQLFGGSEVIGGGPTFAMSGEDGPLLKSKIESQTVSITLTPPTTLFNPTIGTPDGLVNITHPSGDLSQVQVAIAAPPSFTFFAGAPPEDPDFAAAGVQPGDTVLFVCPDPDTTIDLFGFAPMNENQFVTEERIVSSVSGNTVTLTAPLTYDCSGPESSIVFAPRVRVLGTRDNAGLPAPLLTLNEGSLRVRGIYFSAPDDTAFRSGEAFASVVGCHLDLTNVLFYDRNSVFAEVDFYQTRLSSSVSGQDGLNADVVFGQNAGPITFVGTYVEVTASNIYVGNMNILGSRQTGLQIDHGSKVAVDALQVIWSEELTIYNDYGVYISESSSLDVDVILLGRHPFVGVLLNHASSFQVNVYLYSQRNGQYAFAGGLVEWTSVIAARRGSQVSVTNFYGDDNDGQDILIFENSKANINALYISTNRRKTGPALVSTGKFTVDTGSIPATLGNIQTYTEDTFIDHNYLLNVIDGSASPLSLTLNPSEQIESMDLPGRYRFVGRSYEFTISDGANHTITLPLSAVFIGPGVPPGTNEITMSSPPTHACLTLKVVSPTEVLICSGLEYVTPSTITAAPTTAPFRRSFTRTAMNMTRTHGRDMMSSHSYGSHQENTM